MTDQGLTMLSTYCMFSQERVRVSAEGVVSVRRFYPPEYEDRTAIWNPLVEEHQAEMLAAKLGLELRPYFEGWEVWKDGQFRNRNPDMRRAVVVCAANVWMQTHKTQSDSE